MGLILNAKSIGESTCTIKSVEELQRLLLEIDAAQIERYFGLKVAVPDYNDEAISLIGQIAAKVRQKGSDIEVFVNSMEMEFDMSEIERFIELEDTFNKKNIGLYFEGGLENYTLADTLYAQLQINDIVEQINQTKASPFEKYLMAYEFITSRVYKEYEEGSARSRDLIAVLTGDNIVCVGYAKLLKYLCNSVGIQCETQVMDVIQNGSKTPGRHQNNIVYLKDDKYGIDGYYYVDACWDSVNKGEVPFLKYTYALVPFEDVKKMKGTWMNFDSTNFLYKEYAEEDFIVDADRLVLYSRLMGVPMESAQIRRDDEGVGEYFERLSPYMTKILEMLKENQIPADVLSSEKFEKIPKKFYPEFLLAMAVLDPPRLDIIKRTIAEMKKFYESNGKLDKHIEDLKVYATYGYEDIYGRLQETEYIDDIFNVWEFEKYYEIFQNLPTLWLDIERKKSSSKPIDKKTFASALYKSFCLQGMSRENAKKATEVAMKVTAVITRDKFKSDASLCFSKEDSELIDFGE